MEKVRREECRATYRTIYHAPWGLEISLCPVLLASSLAQQYKVDGRSEWHGAEGAVPFQPGAVSLTMGRVV